MINQETDKPIEGDEVQDKSPEGQLIKRVFMLETIPLLSPDFVDLRDSTMQDLLGTLTDREKEFITQNRGMAEGVAKSIDQISKATSYQRPLIDQNIKRGLSKLRHPSRSDLLRPFVPLDEKSVGKQVWGIGFGCELLRTYPHLNLAAVTAEDLDLSFPTTAELLSHLTTRYPLTNFIFAKEKLVRLIMEQTKSPLSPDTQIELRASLQRLENQHKGQ